MLASSATPPALHQRSAPTTNNEFSAERSEAPGSQGPTAKSHSYSARGNPGEAVEGVGVEDRDAAAGDHVDGVVDDDGAERAPPPRVDPVPIVLVDRAVDLGSEHRHQVQVVALQRLSL